MKLKILSAAVAASAFASAAHAQSAGSILLGLGWLHEAPQSSSQPLVTYSVNGAVINQANPGTGATVPATDTLGLSGVYFVTDNIATEFVMGIPPKFEIDGTGNLSGFGKLGTVRQWTPTVLFKYYFGTAQSKLRPYVGVGAAYTWFTDGKITNSNFQALSGTSSSVSASSAWSPAVNAGVSYQLTEHLYAIASLTYLQLKTTATITNTGGPFGVVVQKANIKLNPIISYVSLAYRF
jgi:outer membrane protein